MLNKGRDTDMQNTAENVEVVEPDRKCQRITVRLVPPDRLISLPRPKTAMQLLAALGLAEESALVARDGKLLTPDRRIWPDDVDRKSVV